MTVAILDRLIVWYDQPIAGERAIDRTGVVKRSLVVDRPQGLTYESTAPMACCFIDL